MPHTHARDEGFTLVEVLVALAVILTVASAAVGVIISSLTTQRFAEGTDATVQTAVDRIEEIRQLDWTEIGFTEADYLTTGGTGYDYTTSEDVVFLDAPAATPVHATVTRDTLQVHTYITWALADGDTTYPVNEAGERYAAKRVRVIATTNRAGKEVHEVVETVIAPSPADLVPPGIPITTSTQSTGTCPTGFTATGSPAVLEWDTAQDVTQYEIHVNGTLHTVVPDDGSARYTWTSPLYASETTYEVRGVPTSGETATCPTVTWDPANPTG